MVTFGESYGEDREACGCVLNPRSKGRHELPRYLLKAIAHTHTNLDRLICPGALERTNRCNLREELGQ